MGELLFKGFVGVGTLKIHLPIVKNVQKHEWNDQKNSKKHFFFKVKMAHFRAKGGPHESLLMTRRRPKKIESWNAFFFMRFYVNFSTQTQNFLENQPKSNFHRIFSLGRFSKKFCVCVEKLT